MRTLQIIADYLGEDEVLTQLAEEAAELGKAALKYRRACGYTNNVTPVTRQEAFKNLIEEIADVKLAIATLGLDAGPAAFDVERIMAAKANRWAQRLSAHVRGEKIDDANQG